MTTNGALVDVRNVHKVFRRGAEQIDVLRGVDPRDPARRLRRPDGTVGVGQDDPC